jgi:hypothetical protein
LAIQLGPVGSRPSITREQANLKGPRGSTPLIYAATLGKKDWVDGLLEARADIELEQWEHDDTKPMALKKRRTPLMAACAYGTVLFPL